MGFDFSLYGDRNFRMLMIRLWKEDEKGKLLGYFSSSGSDLSALRSLISKAL